MPKRLGAEDTKFNKMFRDLILLAFCGLLAAGFWFTKSNQKAQSDRALSGDLFEVGAPQAMEDSAEKFMLMGDFRQALQSSPDSNLYDQLAELFLLSFQTQGSSVSALAFNESFMVRVVGGTLEFFDAQGRPPQVEFFDLGDDVSPSSKPLFNCTPPLQLKNHGPWILYRDQDRSLLLRTEGNQLKGYLFENKLTLDGDTVSAKGMPRWKWIEGKLQSIVGDSTVKRT